MLTFGVNSSVQAAMWIGVAVAAYVAGVFS